jgi:uncharacterized protein (TIGR02328 family)
MIRRGYNANEDLIFQALSRRIKAPRAVYFLIASGKTLDKFSFPRQVYTEHNDEYLAECITNLKSKGVAI